MDSLLMPPPSSPAVKCLAGSMESLTPCSPGIGLKDTVEEYLRPGEHLGQDKGCYGGRDIGDELDISGIEDVEIESYLMSPSEIKNKTALWMKVNKEYLKAETEGQTREA